MSYLVSDFLINPVLRQARRFSRPSTASDRFDPLTNRRLQPEIDEAQNETGFGGVMEEPRSHDNLPPRNNEFHTGLSGRPFVSSPTTEEGWNTRPPGQTAERSSSVPDVREHRNTLPLRLASYRSDTAVVDDVSDNPLFNITDRFRADSPMSTSADSINNAGRVSPVEGISRGSSQGNSQSAVLNGVSRHRSSSIPEDDGMRTLRKKILAIQAAALRPEEKAQLMHQLMTEGYTSSQIALHGRIPPPRTHSPISIMSQERPATPLSISSFGFWHSSDSPRRASMDIVEDAFQLTADDLKPTFAPVKPPEVPADNSDIDEEEPAEPVPALGCKHYKRNVKLQCYTCSRWYTCRFCHDENENHTLPRKETRNMLCMLCGCPQRAGDTCADCGARAAWYYCGICKLWDDDASKSIYHCNDCGICRIGRGLGKDFFHCKTCGLCMSISMEQSHKCIERSTDCDCPICGEYMFTSPQTVVFMRCGHTIHRDCYYAHMKTSYKCPICSQTVVNMETQFRNLDRAIIAQPMPPQFQDTKAMVTCNDCRAKSAVPYHWLGLKCAICDSYNTVQLSIISDPEVAVPSIEIAGGGNDTQVDMENREASGLTGPGGVAHTPGPTRTRRHSSHIRPNDWSPGVSSRFSPYPQIQRTARSASPLRGSGLGGDVDPSLAPHGTSFAVDSEEDEDEDITFWGGQPRNRNRTGPLAMFLGTGDGNDYSDGDLSSTADDDMDEDDDDEVDHMELLGHR